jgi:NAD(P)-dependent dehydrogenase (short-subunit alcohol dehydrogenase family)
VAVVTGGGGGIGGALSRALVAGGAKVLITDLDGPAASKVAEAIHRNGLGSAIAAQGDASSEADLRTLIARAEGELGPVALFFANAGIGAGGGMSDDPDWMEAIDVNLMAHVRAARVLVPLWLERGEGYFVATASAAGLLSQIGMAPYSVTKHAAVAFAEWLSITYGARGIRVSCVCPMGVDTAMLSSGLVSSRDERLAARVVAAAGAVMSPADVADEVLKAVALERFLVLPHPEVLEFYQRKGADYDRWLAGMRRLQEQTASATDNADGCG